MEFKVMEFKVMEFKVMEFKVIEGPEVHKKIRVCPNDSDHSGFSLKLPELSNIYFNLK